jgi:hypothetical protein
VNRSTKNRLLALVAIGTTLAVAACGSTSNQDTSSATADQALEYVRCLRSHGVPNFPDPSPGGRLPNVPQSINTAAPAFRSAQDACAKLMPGASGPAAASDNESRASGLLAVARCIRSHGFPNFPDPTTAPPPPPPPGARSGTAIGGPGAYLAFPPSSPALARATAACGFRFP